jgi:HD-GYP domain-containing protein (c-di-GMP phosphodiesterase class II)
MTSDEGRERAVSPASEDPGLADEADALITAGGPASRGGPTFSARQISRVRGLLARLYGVRRAIRFYPSGHPAIVEAVDGLMGAVAQFHEEGVDLPLTFLDDELLLGEQLLAEDSILFDQLIREMTSSGIGSLHLTQGLDAAELMRAMQAISGDPDDILAAGGATALLEQAGAPHVEVGAVRILDRPTETEEERESSRKAYSSALDLLRELEVVVRAKNKLLPGHTKTVVRSLVDNVLSNRTAMLGLSGLKSYDEYTFYHSVNVAILSLALGSAISSNRRFLTSLGTGALMHDIGKLSVGADILNKPGALTSEEWAKMRLHPVHGAEIAATMPGLDRASIVVILEHHMRFDGQGYPRCKPIGSQHLASRIVAVADAFDAMTSRRSYSAPRLQDDAMSVLVENTGTGFHPGLVRLFVRVLGVYPPRSVVRLSSGEVGVVLKPHETDPTSPLVRVIADGSGGIVEPVDVDMGDPEQSQGRVVKGCLDAATMNVDVDDFL